ncbi:MAG: EsaB/YukD family protein [Lachnospiraceae bacterium]|nr:EsaB/YukD family protein [Lachnospiraceae bacterium]
MILADIYIPSLDKTCDFQLDETAPVNRLIAEIAEITGTIVKSERRYLEETFLLCSIDQGIIFERERSLRSYGIQNGARLLLV